MAAGVYEHVFPNRAQVRNIPVESKSLRQERQVRRDICTAANAARMRIEQMTIAQYFEQKTRESQARQEARALAALDAEWTDWYYRKEAAEARGEPFDEPKPRSEEAERRREALESSMLYRLQRHWVWPHIMILFVVCLLIDIIALGFGTVWLVKYIAGIEGSGTVVLILMVSLLLIGTYRLLYKFFRWFYRGDD